MTYRHRGTTHHRQARSRRPTHHVELTRRKLDALASTFLGSEFTGQVYANWPIDRRVHAYLRRSELMDLVNDGDACNAVLECVMTNIGRAQRHGDSSRHTIGTTTVTCMSA